MEITTSEALKLYTIAESRVKKLNTNLGLIESVEMIENGLIALHGIKRTGLILDLVFESMYGNE
jgi:tricorn protease-like protein